MIRQRHISLLSVIGTAMASAMGVAQAMAQSQVPPAAAPPGEPGGWTGVATVAAVFLGLIVLLGIFVKLHDARRRREEQRIVLESRLSDALMQERSLAGLPITAKVEPPLFGGSPTTVVLVGTVPSPQLRDEARELVSREVRSQHVDMRLEDRVFVSSRAA